MLGIGGGELVMIFLVILVLFGAKRIPELARGMGQGMNEFKKASEDLKKEFDKVQQETFSATSSSERKRREVKEDHTEHKQENKTEN